MNYLVFDLEKASCKNNEFKVCEFGFVLTVENFKVIVRGNFHINPNIPGSEWDYMALRKILHYKKSHYLKQPTFDHFYNNIKGLFNKADFIYGHTADGDVQGINDECKRYKLPPINYDFYDIKEFYKVLANVKRNIGVTELREILDIKDDDYLEHDAESDAYTTMCELIAMLEKYNINLKEFLNNNPQLKDSTKDFVISSVALREKKREEMKKQYIEALTSGKIGDGTNNIGKLTKDLNNNKRIFLQFLDNVQVTKKGNGIFDG